MARAYGSYPCGPGFESPHSHWKILLLLLFVVSCVKQTSSKSESPKPSIPVIIDPYLMFEDIKKHLNLPDEEFDKLPLDRRNQMISIFLGTGYAYSETPETNLRWADRALRYFPDSASARLIQAKAYQKMGDLQKASEKIVQALENEKEPLNSINYLHACKDMAEMGKLEEAEKYIQKLIEAAPLYVEARFAQGEIKTSLGKKDEAIEIFREILREFPRSAGAMLNLGVLLFEKGNYSEAENLLLSAANILRVQPEPYQWLTEIYIQKKEWKKARKMLELYQKYGGEGEAYQELSHRIPGSAR